MEELYYMIYILVFIIGLIAGLLLSYKKHMEPYNHGLIRFASPVICLAIAFLFIGYVIGRRPGYGRRETAIGIAIAAIVWISTSGVLF